MTYKVLQPFHNVHTDETYTEGQLVEMTGYTAKDISRALGSRLIEEVKTKKITSKISYAIKEESDGKSNS